MKPRRKIQKIRIAVCIPTIPPRARLLTRAYSSVRVQPLGQRIESVKIIIAEDRERRGAAGARNAALAKIPAGTTHVAFLDDDDEMMPPRPGAPFGHLLGLAMTLQEAGADYAYSYFMVKDQLGRERPDVDPLGHFGKTFDPADPIQTTITTLVRAELATELRFRGPDERCDCRVRLPAATGLGHASTCATRALIDGQVWGEDYDFTCRAAAAGAKIVHRPERTWWWHHHGPGTRGVPGNTSGRPDRW